MKLKTHKVLTVGAFIYAFMLFFGFYFMAAQAVPVVIAQEKIVVVLSADDNASNTNSPNKKSNSLNSRLLIEDDDDSAKDLLNEMNFSPDVYIVPTIIHIETYAPYQKEISTPPPKG
ncbi:MAG: hypothetical protein WAU36_04880 [Cyclobacteriaceae bacterium]